LSTGNDFQQAADLLSPTQQSMPLIECWLVVELNNLWSWNWKISVDEVSKNIFVWHS